MKKIVRAIVRSDQWKILLVKHSKKDFWVLPWWHMEKNENEYQTLKREIKEEFWVKIEFIWEKKWIQADWLEEKFLPVCVYKITYTNTKNKEEKRLEYIFQAKIKDGIIKTKIDEIDEFKWFNKEEIINLDKVYPQIIEIVKYIK